MSGQDVLARAIQGLQAIRHMVIVEKVIQPLVLVLMVVLLTGKTDEMPRVYLAIPVSYLVGCGAALFWLGRLRPDVFHASEHVIEARPWLAFSLPLMLNAVLIYFLYWIDTWVLGHFASASFVGVYTAAVRVAYLTYLPLVALSAMSMPLLSVLFAKGNRDQVRRTCDTVTRWALTLGLLPFIVVLLSAREIVVLFGEDFARGATVLRVLAVGQMMAVLGAPVGQVLVMGGKPRVVMINTLCLCAVAVILNWVLVPRFGLMGAAAANVVVNGASMLARLAEGDAFFDFRLRWRPFWRPLVAGVVSGAVIAVARQIVPRAVPTLVGPVLALAVLYVVLLVCLGMEDTDRSVLRQVLNRGIRRSRRDRVHKERVSGV
jgi:O-antigen/teichoic acid export membrane protein